MSHSDYLQPSLFSKILLSLCSSFFRRWTCWYFKMTRLQPSSEHVWGGDRGIVCLFILFGVFWLFLLCLVMQHSTSFEQLCPGNFLYLHRNHHLPYPPIQKVLSLTLNTSYFLVIGCCQDVSQWCLCQGIQQCVTPHHFLALPAPEDNIRSGIRGVFLWGNFFTHLHDTVFRQ